MQKKLMLFDTSIQYTFEASRAYEVSIKCFTLCLAVCSISLIPSLSSHARTNPWGPKVIHKIAHA